MFEYGRVRSTAAPHERQLAELRARMERITGAPGAAPPAEIRPADLIAISGGLGELLPNGGLKRGSTVACHGATSVLLGLLAEVTAAGHGAAVIGGQRLGLLAFAEMGGDLSLLPIIDPTGADPLEIANALADGVAVLVIDPGTRRATFPAARTRALTQRIRNQRGILMYTDKVTGFRADLTIRACIGEYLGLGAGIGRVQEMMFAVEVSDRSMHTRRTELLFAAADSADRTAWTRISPAEAQATQRWSRTG